MLFFPTSIQLLSFGEEDGKRAEVALQRPQQLKNWFGNSGVQLMHHGQSRGMPKEMKKNKNIGEIYKFC